MPRVPEGNFRLQPSSRVGTPATPKIELGSDRVKKLGKHFIDASNRLEASNDRIRALETASSFQDKYETDDLPVIEDMIQESKKSPDGRLKNGKTLSKAVQAHFEERNSEYMSQIKDPNALKEYTDAVASDMNRRLSKIQKQETEDLQFRHKTTKSKEGSILAQRIVKGDIEQADAQQEYFARLHNSELSNRDREELFNNFNSEVASGGVQYLELHGYTDKNVNKVKGWTNTMPKEIELSFNNKIDRGKVRWERNEVNRGYSHAKQVQNMTDNKQIAYEAAPISRTLIAWEQSPIGQYETAGKRMTAYSGLKAKLMSVELFNDPEFTLANPENLATMEAKLDSEVDKLKRSEINKIFNSQGRFPSADIPTDILRGSLRSSLVRQISIMEGQRRSNPVGFKNNISSEDAENRASQMPDRVSSANDSSESYRMNLGISRDKFPLIDMNREPYIKKSMEALKATDDTGENTVAALSELSREGGNLSGKYLRPLQSSEAIPMAASYMVRSDLDSSSRVARGFNKFDNIMAGLKEKTRDTDIKITKDKFNKAVSIAINTDSNFEADALITGRAGTTAPIAQGYRDYIKFGAAGRVGDGMDMDAAIKAAVADAKEQFPAYAEDTTNSIMIDKKYATEFSITRGDLSNMMSSLKSLDLDTLDESGSGINYAAMENAFNSVNNSTMANIFKSYRLESAVNPRSAQAALAGKLKNHIVVSNDPDEYNKVQLLLRDKQGRTVPLITSKEVTAPPLLTEEVPVFLSIDVNEYIRALKGKPDFPVNEELLIRGK